MTRPFALFLMLLVTGCSHERDAGKAKGDRSAADSPQASIAAADSEPSTARSQPAAPVDRQRADSTLAGFLELSVQGRTPRNMQEMMFCCPDDEGNDVVWVADSKVDSLVMTGEYTADAFVKLTIVARLTAGSDHYIATLGIEELDARFGMGNTGQWHIDAFGMHEGKAFVIANGPMPRLTWLPKGASEGGAFALIDSIRKARGRPARSSE